MKIVVHNLDELKDFVYSFSKKLKGNELIGMSGELGAGKTAFTKFLGKALNVKEEIVSPTFNIVKVYNCSLGSFYHIDAYRLETIGYDPVLDDYLFDENAIRIVEWYEFLKEPIFNEGLRIHIEINSDQSRTITILGGTYV